MTGLSANAAMAGSAFVEKVDSLLVEHCPTAYSAARASLEAYPFANLFKAGEPGSVWEQFWMPTRVTMAAALDRMDEPEANHIFWSNVYTVTAGLAEAAPVTARLQVNAGHWPDPGFADAYQSFYALARCAESQTDEPVGLKFNQSDAETVAFEATLKCTATLNSATVLGYRRFASADLTDWERTKRLHNRLRKLNVTLENNEKCKWGQS